MPPSVAKSAGQKANEQARRAPQLKRTAEQVAREREAQVHKTDNRKVS